MPISVEVLDKFLNFPNQQTADGDKRATHSDTENGVLTKRNERVKEGSCEDFRLS